MNYANKNRIQFVIMVGANEIENGLFTFKNMETGDQKNLSIQQIIETIV